MICKALESDVVVHPQEAEDGECEVSLGYFTADLRTNPNYRNRKKGYSAPSHHCETCNILWQDLQQTEGNLDYNKPQERIMIISPEF